MSSRGGDPVELVSCLLKWGPVHNHLRMSIGLERTQIGPKKLSGTEGLKHANNKKKIINCINYTPTYDKYSKHP